jgi:hypothetical protein
VGYIACTGKMKSAYEVLVGKCKMKRPLKRPRDRWEDNIKMHFREIRFKVMDWIHLAQDWDWW